MPLPARTRVWAGYLEQFHRDRPGITTDTLGTARHSGIDPYQWAVEALPAGVRIVDVACGDGPVFHRIRPAAWVGVDLSGGELRRARGGGAGPLVRADAGRLPLADASAPAVVCSMALMIVSPLEPVLAEIRRVLTADGTAVALLPGGRPLTGRDLLRYGELMWRLRRTHLAYPNDWRLARLRAAAGRAGLAVVDDRRRRFALPLGSGADAGRFVESLYLPGVAPERIRAADAAARRWVPGHIGVPLRRITFRPA